MTYIKDSVNATVEIHKCIEVILLKTIIEYNNIGHGITAFYRLPAAGVYTCIADFYVLFDLNNKSIEIFIEFVYIDLLDNNNRSVNEYCSIAHSNGFISFTNKSTR